MFGKVGSRGLSYQDLQKTLQKIFRDLFTIKCCTGEAFDTLNRRTLNGIDKVKGDLPHHLRITNSKKVNELNGYAVFLGPISSTCLRSASMLADPKSAKKTVNSSSFLRFWDL